MKKYIYGVGITDLKGNAYNTEFIKLKSIYEAKKVAQFINKNFAVSKKAIILRFDE